MKIEERPLREYLYKRPQIENNVCNYCKSNNIFNGRCEDCLKKNITLYYSLRNIEIKSHILKTEFNLSLKQKKASKFFLEHYINKKNAYLNAVCGSGKTEIMYEVILYALNKGDKVLIAIPRKEIVFELYKRLKNVFINTTIKYIDGKNHDDNGELLISTINQLIHYENEFDLIILDEVDAYPYQENEYLERLVKKSLKTDGVIFKMSATEKEKIDSDKYIINRRYHNYDLEYPIFIKDNSKKIDENEKLKEILLNNNRKIIIYTYSIRKSQEIADYFGCEYVNSKNKRSKEIISSFKNNRSNILVSTTILERGITIPNLDVVILDAENRVFSYQTIIQICGRVGRSSTDRMGRIYIFYKYYSLKFLKVKRYIKQMNYEMQDL